MGIAKYIIMGVLPLILLSCSDFKANSGDGGSVAPPTGPFDVLTPIHHSHTNTLEQVISGRCLEGLILEITGHITPSPIEVLCGPEKEYSETAQLVGADGTKGITVKIKDPASTEEPQLITLTLDRVAPSAPTITMPAPDTTVSNRNVRVEGNCETGTTVDVIGDIINAPSSAICFESTYIKNVTLTTGDGNKVIEVQQRDLAQNISAKASVNMKLETQRPPAPTITSPANNTWVKTENVEVKGTCITDNEVVVTTNGDGNTVLCIEGEYTTNISLTNLVSSDGAKTIIARQKNTVGLSNQESKVTVNLDRTEPNAPTVSSPAEGSTVTSVYQTLVGNCEAHATLEITGDIHHSPVTTTCATNGTFNQNVTLLHEASGVKYMHLMQTDRAGNPSIISSLSINLDLPPPPHPTVTSHTHNQTVTAADVTLTGVCETAAMVKISGDTEEVNIMSECINSQFSIPMTLTEGNGAKELSIFQTNAEGKNSPNLNFVLNLQAPE